jgi:hypothetical protein
MPFGVSNGGEYSDTGASYFEKGWIFAYETVKNGVIVRDMAHASTLAE